MDMPTPGEAHKKLSGLIGAWSGSETLYPSPWAPAGGKASARIVNRGIVDGFAVVQEYEQRQGKIVTFRGHGVFWWDGAKQEYAMTWWDSMGGTSSDFRGNFAGDVLTLTCPAPNGGMARVAFDMSKPGRYVFTMDASQDGQTWQPSMDGTYKRGAAAAAAPAKKKAAKKAPMKAVAKKPAKKAAKKAAKKKAKRRTG